MSKCAYKDCTQEAVRTYDHSIQLPDYRNYCEEHYRVVSRKGSIEFNRNMERMTLSRAEQLRQDVAKAEETAAEYKRKADELEAQP